jgi:hypothetical protein
VHACSKLLYSFPFGHYSSYAKVTELKKSLRVKQFARLCGGRGGCGREEEDGREEGAATPLEALRALLLVAGDDDVALVL